MLNWCDAQPGDSGSPIFLLHGEETFIIGLNTSVIRDKPFPYVGLGPSAESFSVTVNDAMGQ